jgi:hypothetical protein
MTKLDPISLATIEISPSSMKIRLPGTKT